VKDVTDFRVQKRSSAWLLRNEIMNNVAGRGKGIKCFSITFRYNYLFIVGVRVYILWFIHNPPPPT
jgi:hypothetical protein